ncbi:MAG: ABC transporter permease, partial [Longimicrobiales bacterium]
MKRDPDGRIDRDIDAELESHFKGTVDLLMRRGWSEADARAEAHRRFGDVDRYRHDLRRIDRRRARRHRVGHALTLVGSSLASALRAARRSPGFSTAVVVTLALGLGANAAVFRVADRLLLSPPEHVEEPAHVRLLSQSLVRDDGGTSTLTAFAWSDVEALRAARLPARVATAVHGLHETLGSGAEAARVRVLRVDSAWFPLIGVEPRMGRDFAPEDHRPDAPPVALIGHALWMSRFGADPDVIGRVLRIGDGRYEVVGVLPEGFVGADPPAADVWLPLEVSARHLWGDDWTTAGNLLAFRIFARLSDADAEAALESAAHGAIAAARGPDYALRSTLTSVDAWTLVPGDGPEPNAMIRVSRWLSAVAALVLLVACANVANLFLAQGER